MKRAICFFTGTGNTYHVALKIQERFPDASLFFIPDTDPGRLQDFDEIGILTPCHMFGLPEIVRKFLKRFRFPGSPRIWLVVTAGGDPGISLPLARQALRRNGKTVAYFRFIRMPDNYIILYKVTAEDKQSLIDSEIAVSRLLDDLEEGKSMGFPPHPWGFLKGFQKLVASSAKQTRRFYRVHGCIGCGKCVRSCPTGNIVLQDRKLTFGKHCTGCLGCLNVCPVHAIDFGKMTVGKERYVYPGIDLPSIHSHP